MNTLARILKLVPVACIALVVSNPGLAGTKPAAAEFYPLVGHWHGHGQFAQPGMAPAKLALKLYCQKVSSGWAVRCAMQARNKQMTMSESDLMGVDPVSGQAHWYAITNQGETHDHLASWPNAHTMNAHYDWTQGGKHMHEQITFKLKGGHAMTFHTVVTADGQAAGDFSGSLQR